MLTLWTEDPGVARRADEAGIDRIGVDLERLGKARRQQGCDTWISPHTADDLRAVRSSLGGALAFARVNPINSSTAREVELVLSAGAQVLMLPMAATARDVCEFVRTVDRRALVVLLIERKEAIDALPELLAVPGVDEVHVGLNDLGLSLDLPNRWALLAGDVVRQAADLVRAAGLPFGFGGIGRAHDGTLPIPSDLVYAEYARTGASRALIARSFGVDQQDAAALKEEITRARVRLAEWQTAGANALEDAHAELGRRVSLVAGW